MPCKEFRLGVFFDGTGNNKENDLAGKSANGPSNVAKLSQLYKNGEEILHNDPDFRGKNRFTDTCEIHTKMIYVEGVGTRSPKMVWKQGRQIGTQYAPGAYGTIPVYEWKQELEYQENYGSGNMAGTEGAQRINNAIEQVRAALKGKSEKEYNRTIDVFGFSRGAAMARDFINTFKYENDDIEIDFGFVGLFDTVASFGLGGDNINLKPINPNEHSEHETIPHELAKKHPNKATYLKAIAGLPGNLTTKQYEKMIEEEFEPYNLNLHIKSAEKVTHLVAADEYRTNFPLTDIKGVGIDNKLIGVHSDIGGGYPPISKEKASFYPDGRRYTKEPLLLSVFTEYDAKTEATRAAKKAQADLGNGWQCKAVKKMSLLSGDYYTVYCEQQRTITDDLQKVGLASMYNQAVLGKAPLNELPEQDIPSKLQAYHAKTTQTPATAASYSPRQPILDEFAHRSSVDSKETHHRRDAGPYDGIHGWDDLKAYGIDRVAMGMNYDESDKPKRTVFENNPNNAVI